MENKTFEAGVAFVSLNIKIPNIKPTELGIITDFLFKHDILVSGKNHNIKVQKVQYLKYFFEHYAYFRKIMSVGSNVPVNSILGEASNLARVRIYIEPLVVDCGYTINSFEELIEIFTLIKIKSKRNIFFRHKNGHTTVIESVLESCFREIVGR